MSDSMYTMVSYNICWTLLNVIRCGSNEFFKIYLCVVI